MPTSIARSSGRTSHLTRWPILCFFWIALSTVPGYGEAQELCAGTRTIAEYVSDQNKLRKLLNERRFDELEKEFRHRELGYESGTYSEESLSYSYSAFRTSSAAVAPLLQEWLNKDGKSYAARVSLAIHQFTVGHAARGKELGRDTSAEQFEAMGKLMAVARSNLEAAFSLKQKPTMAYATALEVERFIGDRKSIDELFASALRADPDSVKIRQNYLLAIDPRWHGSVKDISDALQAIDDSKLPESSKRAVRYGALLQLGGAAWTSKDYDQAAEYFRAASPYCVLADPWQSLANLYNEAGKWREAIDALDHYLAIEPGKAWALRRQAYAFSKLDDWEQALPLYRQAANLGDDYAQNAYGWYLYEGIHIPRDLDSAIRWFQASARQGNELARVNLERAVKEKIGGSPVGPSRGVEL